MERSKEKFSKEVPIMSSGTSPEQQVRRRTVREVPSSTVLPSEAFGKLLPQAVDFEQAVLGALMLGKKALNDVIDILKAEHFYKDIHQRIYRAILTLFQNSEPIDLLTVTNQLRSTGELEIVGGAYYITELTSRVASAANIEYHARIIVQKYLQRELIQISTEVQRDAYEDVTDVFDLLDQTEQKLFSLSDSNLRKDYAPVRDLLSKTIKQLEILKSKAGGITGIPSGFSSLDQLTCGFQPSELSIIAARPGMGKTAFALNVARNASIDHGVPVAFFSLEMNYQGLVQRLICSEAELDAQNVRSGRLREHEWQQLISKIDSLYHANIFIDETPGLSILELRAKCRRLKAEKEIGMVVIDYLQMMHVTGAALNRTITSREQEIAAISRTLKSLANELNSPVIALSQLSRNVETRGGDKRPQLSDLRESGAIEQDADVVMFLYRPEYYGHDTDESGNITKGLSEIIIGKQRNGPTGKIRLRFLEKFGKFVDLNKDSAGGTFYPTDDERAGTPGKIILPSRINDLPPDEPEEGMPF